MLSLGFRLDPGGRPEESEGFPFEILRDFLNNLKKTKSVTSCLRVVEGCRVAKTMPKTKTAKAQENKTAKAPETKIAKAPKDTTAKAPKD